MTSKVKRKIKYKKGDKVEVIYAEPNSIIKVGKVGVIVDFYETSHIYEIDWGEGWVGYLPREHIHRIGDPETFEMIEIKITPTKTDESKGVLKFKHRNVIKKIEVVRSCPYNACKDLVSFYKQDPLKYSSNH